MSTAVILEPGDLDKLIKAITDTVREEISKATKGNPDPPLSRKQAAKFLGINERTLDNKFKSGEFPIKLMHGTGRCKFFFASELHTYLTKS